MLCVIVQSVNGIENVLNRVDGVREWESEIVGCSWITIGLECSFGVGAWYENSFHVSSIVWPANVWSKLKRSGFVLIRPAKLAILIY